jgi:hypothetical protein
MKLRHLMLSSVLAIPALLLPLASCDDSKAPTEPTATDPNSDGIDAPSFTTVGFGSKWHDPHIKGPKVRTFDGTTDTKTGDAGNCGPGDPPGPPACDYGGSAKRFSSQDGAEINTLGFQNVNGAYGGIYPAENKIKGKLLGSVKELDFSYAGGGPIGGSPRFSIPIDECKITEVGAVGEYPCTTDGNWDYFVFADVTDASGCNDGDGFVGVLNGEDDETCTWYERGTIPFPNWKAFAAAHPNDRIARNTPPFVIVDQPGHYLLFKLDLR